MGKLLSPVHLGGRNYASINYQVIKAVGLVFHPLSCPSLERTDRTAFAPSQPYQLPGQSDRRAHRLLPSAQKALARGATPHSSTAVAYPELTLQYLPKQAIQFDLKMKLETGKKIL